MEAVPETTFVRRGILRSYFRSVLAILFLVILMMIIMILPVNTTLKMSFAGSLLFLIVYGIACVVQANLAGLVIQSSGSPHLDDANAVERTIQQYPRPRSPLPPQHRTANFVMDSTGSPSRITTPTRQGQRHHHHHKHRTNGVDDPPPSYEKIDFAFQPDYLPASANPFCDPPPYPTTPPEEKTGSNGPTMSRV